MEGCNFGTITPDKILRDCLVFGISDSRVHERLLQESNLTLRKTDEMCLAAESMSAQMKIVEDKTGVTVNSVSPDKNKRWSSSEQTKPRPETPTKTHECWNCGRRHEYHKELCPAYGKVCNKCLKPNHFAVKCRSDQSQKHIKALDQDGIYRHFVDNQFVDLRFVYKLNTKTSYSWLTKPKTLKLNAKTGGSTPQNPPKLFVVGYK